MLQFSHKFMHARSLTFTNQSIMSSFNVHSYHLESFFLILILIQTKLEMCTSSKLSRDAIYHIVSSKSITLI